ncbi:amylo-alpha-1,6-glucosidase [Thiohalorhabdus denitrificans]|uniref:beta-fructofuranosidase n=1 Tax=Thiohalorhabdus denitrificans TaxID=381306 RepID=A0A1G5C0B7_9GAMM|nr:glycoside hydrolase 100 family protein [Thiohalorhabdus denitrificans]SCX95744.1 Alkaline and neutral invertase [Thiohalorhabdus denitrificans]
MADTGYRKALELLQACTCSYGFLASPVKRANYRRVWARDGVILGLAALMSGDEDLAHTFRRTLETLARYQGRHGEIPSNVDPEADRTSYGGTTGRVDADLWFVIGCGQYWQATGDEAFLEAVSPTLERVQFLLGAWEFNNRGLLYVPLTGDWADEYLQNGYVLYDQLLYLRAQWELARIHREMHGSADHPLEERMARLRHFIRANYWFFDGETEPPADAYHEILWEKGREAACFCHGRHWLPFFSPSGYGYRFDAFANILASLTGVADDAQREAVDDYVSNLLPADMPLVPAFHPVITPRDEEWEDLQMTFSYAFKNQPYEYQNGGLWPMLSGFYVADLARRGRSEQAQRILAAIDQASALPMDGEPWSFPEYVHGRELTAGGNRFQGWSAAGAVIAHHAVAGQPVFR